MKKVTALVEYKTKVKKLHDGDSIVDYVEFKRVLSRSDCNLNACQHDYYNSDLFIGMLNGAYKNALKNQQWARISDLPASVTIDTSKFLAVVTVKIEV